MDDINDVLWQCFRHFVHLDESNAAIDCAPVRYSPITFRLSDHLDFTSYRDHPQAVAVRLDKGTYSEDPGR